MKIYFAYYIIPSIKVKSNLNTTILHLVVLQFAKWKCFFPYTTTNICSAIVYSITKNPFITGLFVISWRPRNIFLAVLFFLLPLEILLKATNPIYRFTSANSAVNVILSLGKCDPNMHKQLLFTFIIIISSR